MYQMSTRTCPRVVQVTNDVCVFVMSVAEGKEDVFWVKDFEGLHDFGRQDSRAHSIRFSSLTCPWEDRRHHYGEGENGRDIVGRLLHAKY